MIAYLDNAATTRVWPEAAQAAAEAMTERYFNPSSRYPAASGAAKALESDRAAVAKALGCSPRELTFTSCGTESDNWAVRAAAEYGKRKGKHIITTAIEHHAVLHTAQWLEKQGYEVTCLPVDREGRVDPAAVRAAIRPDTILISVMAANNEIGTVEPIAEIGAIAREAGVLFHTDAVQAVGHIPVNVEDWKVDLLSLSGHKIYGPRGIGVLYMRKPLRLPPLIHGGGQERGRRSGTENVAAAVGLAAALREAVDGMEEESRRLSALRDKLLDGLSALPYARVTGSRDHRLPGTASLVFEGVEGEALLLQLDRSGICASSGSACSSASLDPSHVLLAIGLPHAIAHGSLRLSLGRETTEEDVDAILREVPQAVQYLREMSPVWDRETGRPTWDLDE